MLNKTTSEKSKVITFSGRAHSYTQEEKDVVVDAMTQLEGLTQGNYQQKFEQAIQTYLASDNKVFVLSSATAGLEIAAQLCQFKKDDEVIIPAHTYTSSAYPFFKHGAKIVWSDIDLNTRVMSLEQIKACTTKKTKALVVVHLYGYASDMSEIMAYAKKNNIIVIEDCAQAIGAEVHGKKVGCWGDVGIFSFHSHKNISTLGEGGAITSSNKEFEKLIPLLRHNGHCDFNFERDDYWKPCMGNVDMPILNEEMIYPNNFCLGEVQCAVGIPLLKRLDAINLEKRKRAISIIDQLERFSLLKFHRVDSDRHTYYLLVAEWLGAVNQRDQFIQLLYEKYSIQCIVQYYPLYRYDLYKKVGLGKADCPNTDQFFDHMISFPFHHWLSDDDVDYIIESINKVYPTIDI